MLAISITASVSSYSLAQTLIDDASIEEQLRFFEFLAQSVVKDNEVITPVDFSNEESQSDAENSDQIETQNEPSSSQKEEIVQ